jgi:peptidoglycan/xylan/chitin deacetylase (PgdA/CDA1 family)
MKIFGARKIRQAFGWLERRLGLRAVILLYHRVTESASDPCLLRVTPQHFAEHLQVIRAIGHPMRLDVLAGNVRARNIPARAICITFDDGYQDNLSIAKPLLERYDVPATVFMTTGTSGRSREFWWDELERIFLQPGHLPTRLALHVDGQFLYGDLGESSIYSEADFRRDKDWNMLVPGEPTPRHTMFRAVYHRVMQRSTVDQQQVLDRLLHWAGMTPVVRMTHRALEPHEVVELVRGGLVEIGAHTVTHPALSTQPAAVQWAEIRQSKLDLEAWLGRPINSFAYPYGLYSEPSVTAVRESGFKYACACLSRTVQWNSNLFLLPRLTVLNWDGDEFARQLRKQLGG